MCCLANVGGKDASANYKHALDGLVRIAREEGVLRLWRGVGPNLLRGALMTAGQVATYDQVKELAVRNFHMVDDSALPAVVVDALLRTSNIVNNRVYSSIVNNRFWPSLGTHFVCSNVAGLVATFICSPVDVVKTRVMNAKRGEYSSAVQCAVAILRGEGAAA
jgi:dicarboxylate transporter 10